jgi:hypothetical protein
VLHELADRGGAERYTSFVIAMTIAISTNTTIAICIQIQDGDIRRRAYFAAGVGRPPLRLQREAASDVLPLAIV